MPDSVAGRNVVLLCDFDGTITEQDVGIVLLEEFSTTDWRVLEEAFSRGEVDIRRNMQDQFSHVPHDAPALLEYARERVTIRPGWQELVGYCHEHGLELDVLSGGLQFYVEALMPETDPMPRVHCLDAVYTADGWQVSLPAGMRDEDVSTGFKERVVEQYRERFSHVWFIGNGTSDRGAAAVADRVWAVEPLLSYCRERGIAVTAFETFYDITADIQADPTA